MNTRCDAFDRWLDDGRPEAPAAASHAHAAGCARCARALRAAEEIERTFAVRADERAPAGFAERVMARVLREGRKAGVPVAQARPAPWQRPVANGPLASAAALAVLAVLYRRPIWAAAMATAAWTQERTGALAGGAARAVSALSALTGAGTASPAAATWAAWVPGGNAILRAFARPAAGAGLMLALAPALFMMSWWMVRVLQEGLAPRRGSTLVAR